MKEEVLNIIYSKLPVQQKKIKALFEELPEIEEKLEEFLKDYEKFMILENISIEDLANSYVEMLNQLLFCRKEFLYTGKYYTANQDIALQEVYNNEHIMTNYMLALALSQFLWKHHYQIFNYYKSVIASLSEDSKILEVGSGHGLFTLEILKSKKTFLNIDIVDISQSSIRMTENILKAVNSSYLQKVNFYHFDINEYITETKYDFINIGEVIEHVDDPLRILKSLFNLLNDNGKLFITTCANCPAIDHVYLFNNIDEIRALIQKAGFMIETEVISPSENKSDAYLEKFKVDISYAALIKKQKE